MYSSRGDSHYWGPGGIANEKIEVLLGKACTTVTDGQEVRYPLIENATLGLSRTSDILRFAISGC